MKNIYYLLFASLLFSSCVSSKLFRNIERRYGESKASYNQLFREHGELEKDIDSLVKLNAKFKSKNETITEELEVLIHDYDEIKENYGLLEIESNQKIIAKIDQNEQLLNDLNHKEGELENERKEFEIERKGFEIERKKLDSLGLELNNRITQIDELEKALAEKENATQKLKKSLLKELLNFDGKGLTITHKNGKVYVSMENKLLFKPGSWKVGKEGKQALNKVGFILANNKDINVLVEGHTDNQPYIGNNNLSGNWDLSVKRATEIVKLLIKNKKINPRNLTAAGRGKFNPVRPNDTPENRKKNRRTDIILTPKLDKVTELLNQFN